MCREEYIFWNFSPCQSRVSTLKWRSDWNILYSADPLLFSNNSYIYMVQYIEHGSQCSRCTEAGRRDLLQEVRLCSYGRDQHMKFHFTFVWRGPQRYQQNQEKRWQTIRNVNSGQRTFRNPSTVLRHILFALWLHQQNIFTPIGDDKWRGMNWATA
jgi:hypothetical protein